MRRSLITRAFKDDFNYFKHRILNYEYDSKITFSNPIEKRDFIRFSIVFEFPDKISKEDEIYFLKLIKKFAFHYFDYDYDIKLVDYDKYRLEFDIELYPIIESYQSMQRCKTIEDLSSILDEVKFLIEYRLFPLIEKIFKFCASLNIKNYSDISKGLKKLTDEQEEILFDLLDASAYNFIQIMEELNNTISYDLCKEFMDVDYKKGFVKEFPKGREAKADIEDIFSYYRTFLVHFSHKLRIANTRLKKLDLVPYLEFLWHFKETYLNSIKNAINKMLEKIKQDEDYFKESLKKKKNK